jgi:RHS repeat-associated protein
MITKRTRRSLFAAAAAAAFAAAAAAQTEWNSGTISYDGSGNIVAMGQDVYVYDSVGRLVSGTANQQQSGVTARQDYSYDAFGNRLTVTTTGTGCVGRCAPGVNVSTVTNRVSGNNATYDSAGHMKSFGAESYTYDGAEMVSRVTDATIDWQFVYTADDERLATYTGQGNWRFTVRDVDKTVLREVTAYQGQSGTTWTWDRDHVYRDGLLLATLYPSGQRQQFHLDHLGSPRVVTDVNGARIGLHSYYPFGDELALNSSESLPERMKFTGHERDTLGGDEPLDYMHARDYSPTAGRFLSLDAHAGAAAAPQTWNRYVYAGNNPMSLVDPDGREPLDPGVRHFLEMYYGRDLSHVQVYGGFFSRILMSLFRGSDAVTIGRRIFFEPSHFKDYKAKTATGIALAGHEVRHVFQYAALGIPGFVRDYLHEYFQNRGNGMSPQDAYEKISFEQVAEQHQQNILNFFAQNAAILTAIQMGLGLTDAQDVTIENANFEGAPTTLFFVPTPLPRRESELWFLDSGIPYWIDGVYVNKGLPSRFGGW